MAKPKAKTSQKTTDPEGLSLLDMTKFHSNYNTFRFFTAADNAAAAAIQEKLQQSALTVSEANAKLSVPTNT